MLQIFYYWNDYEKHKDPKRILIIYGAGVAGKHFVNINGLKPQYFYDKCNAIAVEDVNGTRYPVYQLTSLPVPPNSDVIVSLTRKENLKEFMASIDLFPEECNLYFFPMFNFETLDNRIDTTVSTINGKPTIYANYVDKFKVSLTGMLSNGAFAAMDTEKLKGLFLHADSSFGLNYLENLRDNNITINKHGYLTEMKKDAPLPSVQANLLSEGSKLRRTVYLFGNCAFCSRWSHWPDSIERLLSVDEELDIKIENYSYGPYLIDDVFIEIMNIEFDVNSVVILNFDPQTSFDFLKKIVMLSNRLKSFHVRFIFMLHFNLLFKNSFGLYECFLIEKLYENKLEMIKEREELAQKYLQFQETMLQLGIECHTYSGEIYDADTDVFVDKMHVADLGNKYIAKFIKNVILKKVLLPDLSDKIALYSLNHYQTLLNTLHQKIDPYNTKFIGAIVMNCNPFTNGHRFLIEQALKNCDSLIIFVVSEDKSYFNFEERMKLVQQGTADLANVYVIPSGSFIISQFTFSDYFRKSDTELLNVNCERDLEIFCDKIAPCADIKIRFVGEEPIDIVTNQYNKAMKRVLSEHGIKVLEVPRASIGNAVISASTVRNALKLKDFDKISKLVPLTTLNFLKAKFL